MCNLIRNIGERQSSPAADVLFRVGLISCLATIIGITSRTFMLLDHHIISGKV